MIEIAPLDCCSICHCSDYFVIEIYGTQKLGAVLVLSPSAVEMAGYTKVLYRTEKSRPLHKSALSDGAADEAISIPKMHMQKLDNY